MFHAVQRDLPRCAPTLIMRSIGLTSYENSKFANELFYPGFVDEFFDAPPEARDQILREMHRTNYSGLAPGLLETLYRQFYVDRLTDERRLAMHTMTDVTAARERDGEIVLELRDRKTGSVEWLACDLVLLGTGYVREMPALVRGLTDRLGLDAIDVTRSYRVRVPGPAACACYLQGVNEATHGIADSLLSVLAHRAWQIAEDITSHRLTAGSASSLSRFAA
jgi:L-ornithine N5-oxygenase